MKRVAYDSRGRQKKKSVNIIIETNVASATKACMYCPEETELPSRLPNPCSVYVFDPKDIISGCGKKIPSTSPRDDTIVDQFRYAGWKVEPS